MIEVRLTNGDWAEAETPEDAMRCARELWENAIDARSFEGRYFGRATDLTATFVNALTGEIVATGIDRATMLSYA